MRTIRERLTRRMLLAFSVPLIVGVAGVYFVMRAELGEQFDAALRAKALALAATTQQRGELVDVDESNRLLREFDEIGEGDPADGDAERPVTSFFQIRRSDGTTVRRSRSLGTTDLPQLSSDAGVRFANLTLPSGATGRAIAIAFRPRPSREVRGDAGSGAGGDAQRPPALQLVVAVGRASVDETMQTLAIVLGAASASLLAVMLLLVPRLVTREFAPIGALAQQASEITAASLDTRFPAASMPGELAPIATTLNELLGRLQAAFERERQFGADLAHELRTPIAELRAVAELAMRWPESRESTTDQDALLIAEHMEALVSRLLALQRSERAQLAVEWTPVSLGEAIHRGYRPFAIRAETKGLSVKIAGSDNCVVETDAVLLQSILTNVLENAVEYASSQTALDVVWSASGDRFSVAVTNVCDGVSVEDLSRFFDRLWRKEQARTGSEHSGLGLSLARAFAEAMSYTLTAELTALSSIRLTLSGPARPNTSADFQISSIG